MEKPGTICIIVQCEFYSSIKMYLSKKPLEKYNPASDLHRLTTCTWTGRNIDIRKMLQEYDNDQDLVVTILLEHFLTSCKENLLYICEITTPEIMKGITARAENFIHLYVVRNARSQSA